MRHAASVPKKSKCPRNIEFAKFKSKVTMRLLWNTPYVPQGQIPPAVVIDRQGLGL
jgi:hypothetical protein